jgi:subtilisin family serine protease
MGQKGYGSQMLKKRIFTICLAAAVTVSMMPVISVSAAEAAEAGPAYNGYIVAFSDSTADSTIEKIVGSEGDGCEEISDIAAQDQKLALVSVESDETGSSKAVINKVVEGYEDHGSVVSVSPNYRRKVCASVNDTYSSSLYQFSMLNISSAWSQLEEAGLPAAKVKVALIDTGAALDHEDLQSNLDLKLAKGFTSGGDTASGDDVDSECHGTHVAGIIAATANNSLGVAGAASGDANNIVDLIPVSVLSSDGYIYDEDIVRGISYALSKGAQVINMSLGGETDDPVLDSAINNAYSSGVTVVCAAGNEAENNNPVEYPAASAHTISVAACGSSGARASFSTYNEYVDVMAPGVRITSTVNFSGGTQYTSYSGTSMACPMVTAEAALLYAADPDITPAEVYSYITSTASHPETKDVYTGYGIVNYSAAVGAALAGKTPSAGETENTSVAKVSGIAAKALGGRKIKVSWSGVTGASKYQIAKKKQGGSYSVTAAGSSARAKTYTKLAKGRYYYFKVRAVRTVDGSTYYGSWSAVKKIKVK